MSDFLKKVKSVFIVDDPATDGTSTTAQQPTQAASAPASTPVAQAVQAGSVNDKFIEILSAALEKANQDGFDYFEFRQALKNLEKMPMDEPTRYQSAYALAQTMGASASKLMESAKYYLTILQGEQSKFNEAHTQQKSKIIGGREEEAKNLEAMIVQKTEQINQLTREIEEHRQRSVQIRAEITDSTVKIEQTKADFDTTLANISGNIESDISKIQRYLNS